MILKVDFVGVYQAFLALQSSENDLDVLEIMTDNLDAIEDLAVMDKVQGFGLAIDDTTMIYMQHLIHDSQILHQLFEPLCEEFLGISKTARAEALKLLPRFLVGYGIILYKRFGYEAIAEYYAINNSIDTSQITLPEELLEEVSNDLTNVVDTMRTILVVFKTFGAYFAEYQIGDEDDLADVINNLENRNYGTESISMLSQEEVQRILSGDGDSLGKASN